MSRPRAEVPADYLPELQVAAASHREAVAALDHAALQLQAAVVAALGAGGSYRAVAQEAGLARSTVIEWARQARAAKDS